MFLKVIFIYWPLLSVIIAAALGRLVHNAKIADRALEGQ
ncbi:nitrate reductase NapE component [Pseudomonas sp. 3296]|nr:nitrate reductase NapE component [Pseudomonas sp. 3296]